MQRHPVMCVYTDCCSVPRGRHALLRRTALRSPPGRLPRADREQSGHRQNSRRLRVPRWTRDVCLSSFSLFALEVLTTHAHTRIVLQGQELLTSNMMVRPRRGVEGQIWLSRPGVFSCCIDIFYRCSRWLS